MDINRIKHIFSHPPQLETDRLTLRRIQVTDSPDMYDYARDPQVTEYLLWSPHPDIFYTQRYLEAVQDEYREGRFYDWALVCKADGHMIGTCGFTEITLKNNAAEIGYVVNPSYWGRGYATEAVKRVLDYGFRDLRLNRIEARYMFGNDRSRRVMEKCGMTFEGVQRSLLYVKDQYRDIGFCSILAKEYFSADLQM